MKCFNPIKAKRDDIGNILFTNDERQGISEVQIPCGQCMGCRVTRVENWAVRMIHECQFHDETAFLTLTYNDENLPKDGSLNYEHPRNFIKRLRKLLSKTKYDKQISYYYSGEYGDQFTRPHYHMIIFGFDFQSKIKYKGEENVYEYKYSNDNGDKFYTSTLLDSLWTYGTCDITNVTYDTCAYTAKYVTKRITGDQSEEYYQGREKEKGMMSRSKDKAIGKRWLEKFWKDVYPDDFVRCNDKFMKVPKYYDKWMEKNNPQLLEEIKIKRESFSTKENHIDLNRSYEVKLLKQQSYKSSYEQSSAPLNPLDVAVMEYKKRGIEDYHYHSKEKL